MVLGRRPEILVGRNSAQNLSLMRSRFRRDFGKWTTQRRGSGYVSGYGDGDRDAPAAAVAAGSVAGMPVGASSLLGQELAVAAMVTSARNRRALLAVGLSLACRLRWWMRVVERPAPARAGRLEMAVPSCLYVFSLLHR